MLKFMKRILIENPTKLVFTEAYELRVLNAAIRLKEEQLLEPILVGDEERVMRIVKEHDLKFPKMTIINPETFEDFDQMVDNMVELRKGKMTKEQAEVTLKKANYFGTMLVKMGYADGLIGGATYSTADTVRPALQLIKTKPGSNIVSSCFIMNKDDHFYLMGDCAINIDPSSEQLAEIAIEVAKTARLFGLEPRVAMLSYSTLGSGAGPEVDKVRRAVEILREQNVDFKFEGEIQFDAAISPTVAATKAPNSEVAGTCNVFIFPNINAGNIGYKIAQRLGGYEAIGPILLGLNAPINDLSRGCCIQDIYKMAIITAAQKYI